MEATPNDDFTEADWLQIAEAMAAAIDEPKDKAPDYVNEGKKIAAAMNELFKIVMERQKAEGK